MTVVGPASSGTTGTDPLHPLSSPSLQHSPAPASSSIPFRHLVCSTRMRAKQNISLPLSSAARAARLPPSSALPALPVHSTAAYSHVRAVPSRNERDGHRHSPHLVLTLPASHTGIATRIHGPPSSSGVQRASTTLQATAGLPLPLYVRPRRMVCVERNRFEEHRPAGQESRGDRVTRRE